MDEEQNSFNQDEDSDAVNASGGAEEQGVPEADQGSADKDDPYGVKKRLGMQAKKHAREMRQMQENMLHMQSQIGQQGRNSQDGQASHANAYPYPSPGQPSSPGMNEEQKIHAAVRYALGFKENEEKQAREAEGQVHVQKQYKRLNEEFDKASDKYEDFDDVVRGDDVPFTNHTRDAMLLIDNPADVAYQLGKNRDELTRISKLHPLDQAREVNKLSFALMGGNTGKPQTAPQRSNPMGSIRANPANASTTVTDKTPPSAIRARMKAGTWK